jgi:hypothetical protein
VRIRVERGTAREAASGFVLLDVPDFVISARHPFAPGPSAITRIVVAAWDGNGEVEFEASGLAHPAAADERHDVAVLRLPSAFATDRIPPVDLTTEGPCSAMLTGYPAGAALAVVPIEGTTGGGFLDYRTGAGRLGMSGGPVAVDLGITALHRATLQALLLDFDVINPLLSAL